MQTRQMNHHLLNFIVRRRSFFSPIDYSDPNYGAVMGKLVMAPNATRFRRQADAAQSVVNASAFNANSTRGRRTMGQNKVKLKH